MENLMIENKLSSFEDGYFEGDYWRMQSVLDVLLFDKPRPSSFETEQNRMQQKLFSQLQESRLI